ncbi:hypothetical protein LTR10_017072 [Elasticomyces elasticus]|uniref:EXPERA domain-containing protein n=1 Tax=Exophiala sideris TaxID=1016849 RepID=A0ABR0IZR3_9EURO|nr:hypothetical protein LTR10_017072 [Elasticomyces elasticus]KAK5023080.1 hypothetical protein LTS07_009573 [Exophiala sideris]KAK5026805.1 hypothetical protein LTR13_009845 [Exophiala sideris]KAK5052458.1 hypothetical protein LTR69_009796 [Exophiala sideris]KAK5178243.1 hypothetical protein LTR44_009327 [Eurotiomycetes sp. CCFEE 6388]
MNFLKKATPSLPETVADLKAVHPFYPVGVEIANFIANDKTVGQLLGVFAAGCVVILSATWFLASKAAPQLNKKDKLVVLWFCLSYFSYNHTRMGGAQDLFGQMWKEYAMSDSRYLTSDPFVLCMETVTAVFWGPLSFLMIYFIITMHPLRYPLQAVVSLGQIYGDVLYYATCMFDHYYKSLTYCRPEAYYFWFYFFFMNFIWIVIPGSE